MWGCVLLVYVGHESWIVGCTFIHMYISRVICSRDMSGLGFEGYGFAV